jgi:hypothetical protein
VAQRSPASDRAPTVGERYPVTRTHSPITPAVAARLRDIAARSALRSNVFAKVGASATVNRNYLRCFAGPHVDLGGRAHLEGTLRHFNRAADTPGWTNPFRRVSEAAGVGWNAWTAVRGGASSPVAREVRAIDPRFALATYGTNDLELRRPVRYARLMNRVIGMLEVRGVVPLLLTTMPRDDSAESDHYVGLYNAILRAIAQGRRLPLLDHYRELVTLPDHGLAGDGVHPNVHFVDGRPRGCDFGPEGVRHGYNLRNLVALEALDRARRVVVGGEAAPDVPTPAAPPGRGSTSAPFRIEALPFSHASDVSRSPFQEHATYPGCDGRYDGPEVTYRFELDEAGPVVALVLPEDDADVGVHLLDAAGRCLGAGTRSVRGDLAPGSYRLVVDSASTGSSGVFYVAVDRVDRRSVPLPRPVPEAPETPPEAPSGQRADRTVAGSGA